MNDRELLEKAAKLIGMHPEHWQWDGDGMRELAVHAVPHCGFTGPQWNPITDDGDALRLAARLELRINIIGQGMCEVMCPERHLAGVFEHDRGGDTLWAIRRAIVRAAAALSSPSQGSRNG